MYANEVRRCEELERIIRYFEEQLKSQPVKRTINIETRSEEIRQSSLDSLESTFNEKEKELRQLNKSLADLMSQRNIERERSFVITLGEQFVKVGHENVEFSDDSAGDDAHERPLIINDMQEEVHTGSKSLGFGYMTGVINRDKVPFRGPMDDRLGWGIYCVDVQSHKRTFCTTICRN